MAQYSRGNLVYTDFQFYLTFNTKSTESVSIIVGSGHLQQVYNAHPVMDAKNHLFPVSNNAEVWTSTLYEVASPQVCNNSIAVTATVRDVRA